MNNTKAGDQPSGTLTFLFSDIEGSTKVWESHPIEMRAALAQHDDILRSAIENHHGQIVKTTGDGVHAGFPNAADAVQAALDAQQGLLEPLAGLRLKVRMSVHSGDAELRAGDYYGGVLNRAARLMSAAHGGQILVSNATAELLRDQLPVHAGLRDLGEHRLKDLTRPEHIFQLTHPDLPEEFPPLATLESYPNNLPVQLTSFVGREKETGEVRALLAKNRLVTLTGSGGTGKTRLALEAGAQEVSKFSQGVWLVELAPLADPAQILPALAHVLGLMETSTTTLARLVAEYLREKQVLLLLDNCEHLIDACARLADDLLHACPRLKMLASSREALGIAGEVAYRTPSLGGSEATQLFLERARAANPQFRAGEAQAAAIEKICARLDGIPLAIELAAARTRLLTPAQIAERLDDRFRLLVGGSRTALPRQQTLRAMIDWSYDLLSVAEKKLLRNASVFAGGWRLEALEAVADDPQALEHLEQLVNKSLVTTEDGLGGMRYTLLETIRQYAREKLFDAGAEDAAQARDRHLAFYVQMAEAALPRLAGPEMIECMDELEAEQDNLRAAIAWAVETDPLSALRMGGLLPTFWGRRLSATEGIAWVQTALARAEERIPMRDQALPAYLSARAMALSGEASLYFGLGNNDSARKVVGAGIDLARQANALETLANALALGATICGFLGEVKTAREWLDEAHQLAQNHGFIDTYSRYVILEAFFSAMSNQPPRAGIADAILSAARTSGNPWTLALAYSNAGRIEMSAGRWAEAAAYLAESVIHFQKIGDRSMVNASRSEMGHLLRKQGRLNEAIATYRETITTFQELSEHAAVAHELECFAFIAVAQNQDELAARLLGAAQALRERLQTDMTPIERQEYDASVTSLHAHMDAADLERTWAEGRAMTMQQAIEMARTQLETGKTSGGNEHDLASGA